MDRSFPLERLVFVINNNFETSPTVSRFGLPEMIDSDNGTALTSAELKEFVEKNGMRHLTTAPYHAASNGLPERAVQTVKRGLFKQTAGI